MHINVLWSNEDNPKDYNNSLISKDIVIKRTQCKGYGNIMLFVRFFIFIFFNQNCGR